MIGGRKRDNGLYLEKFETREEAQEYIEKLANRYRYAPNQKEMSLRRIIEDAKKDGVVLYKHSLSTWFKKLGVKIRHNSGVRESTKKHHTFTISHELIEVLDVYPNKSYMAELGLRIVTGMPVEDVILFLPYADGEQPINVIFKKTATGRIKVEATGKLKETDKQHIKTILMLANEKGIGVVSEYATTFGFRYYGGD